ncbi:MAG: class I SAM-dependent methyltransferase [Acidobacteriota bacterium]|nr:class I SAM-dependent methyltransferase [Acidobacteriota bacterium]
MNENPAPFFELGEADVERLVSSIRAADRDARLHSVLEYGCGPGRLIPAFLRRGIAVTAVDVSPRMLALAAENTARSGGTAVFLEEHSLDEQEFDLVTTVRVMQHIPATHGAATVRRLATRVRRGGYLYLDLPFRSTRSTLSRAALALRASVPALNAIANAAKGRPRHAPVSTVHVHSLDAIALALQESGMEIVSIDMATENELTTASILARAVQPESQAAIDMEPNDVIAPPPPEAAARSADYIFPGDLIRATTIEELNVRAEQYFAGLDSADTQLAKPFASPTDSPAMLISLGTILHGMHLAPGMTVLDFGGGTGWLSRALLQLGCKVILCDVSSSALRIARQAIEKHPPIGAVEDIQYLLYDGHRLDVPDATVHRVICFDAFHHAPNPDQVIREFARILRPGGLAAFSEPGPHHSHSPQSQFEMRVYGVLENDVDVPHIWQVAREAGFDDLRMGIFTGAPTYVPLDEFQELLRGGTPLREAARRMRDFLTDVSTFTLHKRGEESLDSRTARGLLCRIEVHLPPHATAGEEIPFIATVENIGTSFWLPSASTIGGVSLGSHLYRDDQLVKFDFEWWTLTTDGLAPGTQTTVHGIVPPLEKGRHAIEFDCVANRVTWFEQAGSISTRATVEVG